VERHARVSDLVDNSRPPGARSVLAWALLGASEPRLRVSQLVAVASLFGISSAAARTCLSRMVADGELRADDATYALVGHLLDRRERVDNASRITHTSSRPWNGTWEISVVSLDRRAAMDRLNLRKAAAALHLAEIREGVWARPDNLEPDRLPKLRAVLEEQSVRFCSAETNIPPQTTRALFGVEGWANDAHRLIAAMNDEFDASGFTDEDVGASLPYQFTLSIAVVNHLESDPLLPAVLLPGDWPAESLRSTYRAFDEAFQQTMRQALRTRPSMSA